MISAPNHQRPLSGNRWILVLSIGLLVFTGCGIFGPASKKTDSDKDTDVVRGTPTNTSIPVDTIEWNVIPEEEAPPITERSEGIISKFKDVYSVVLLAPLEARRFQTREARATARMVRMIEFLAGVQFGVQHCLDNVNIRLTVIDTEEDPEFLNNLNSRQEMQDADIIIGPYHTDKVEAVAKFALENHKIVISPWNTIKLEEANPYYIQMRPSLQSHAHRLARFVREHYPLSEVMLMTKNDPRDISALEYFQVDPVTHDTTSKIREEIVPDIGNSDLTDSLAVYIQERNYRRFIVPVWSDEPFVIAALSKLNFAKGEEEITVFGLPQWMEMSRMDYEYFENLHVHLSSARPVDYISDDAKDFKAEYITRYGDLPGTDAFYGMNLIKWLGSLLKTEGTNITTGLGNNGMDLDEEFEFVAIFSDDGEFIHHYENQKVDIIRFADFQFQKVD